MCITEGSLLFVWNQTQFKSHPFFLYKYIIKAITVGSMYGFFHIHVLFCCNQPMQASTNTTNLPDAGTNTVPRWYRHYIASLSLSLSLFLFGFFSRFALSVATVGILS